MNFKAEYETRKRELTEAKEADRLMIARDITNKLFRVTPMMANGLMNKGKYTIHLNDIGAKGKMRRKQFGAVVVEIMENVLKSLDPECNLYFMTVLDSEFESAQIEVSVHYQSGGLYKGSKRYCFTEWNQSVIEVFPPSSGWDYSTKENLDLYLLSDTHQAYLAKTKQNEKQRMEESSRNYGGFSHAPSITAIP